MEEQTHPTFGNGKICYIVLPAKDIKASAEFYRNVFGWNIRTRSDGSTAFDDSVNEVSGTWDTGLEPIDGKSVMIYLMVDFIEVTVDLIIIHGGQIVVPVGMESPETTARFTDPAGNIIGIYQQ
ncbi:VOC family protein [Pedobacter sp. HMF7647]|uniref:VOC family protein n=1 Tax=Hufsiella arboris TaxID=2695275 RepID=A0A7K1Y7E4_9SPHI|nr:VOC family protein [Hufsiella arboris]MXV49988.1 VOC family protein [Hufsiella arboris]